MVIQELSLFGRHPVVTAAKSRMSAGVLLCTVASSLLTISTVCAHASLARKSPPQATHAGKKEQTAPKGPLMIDISIANQQLTLFDDGVAIAHAPVSTGMSGHPTPLGVFSVIQKQRWHESNIYSGAPMPFMQRITWSGVALHAGVLPGYPASHGCIRLPHEFAVRLFGMTKMGARVFVTRNEIAPVPFVDAHLFTPQPIEAPAAALPADGAQSVSSSGADRQSNDQKELRGPRGDAGDQGERAQSAVSATGLNEALARVADASSVTDKLPDDTVHVDGAVSDIPLPQARPQLPQLRPGPLSIFISRKLKRLFVRKGFDPIFDAPVEIAEPERPFGTHIFTATGLTDDHSALRWLLVSMPSEAAKADQRHATGKLSHKQHEAKPVEPPVDTFGAKAAAAALDRIDVPADVRERIAQLLGPGASLIISDKDLGPETGSGDDTDFVVLTR